MNRKAIITLIAMTFAAVAASADSVTFHASEARNGMTWNESAEHSASVTLTTSSAAPVTTNNSSSSTKTNVVLAIGNDGRIDSVEVTYGAASNASVAHHSYVVTPSGVTYSGGGAPSAEEVAYVRADNAQFGQFRALERIFDGETIAIGSSFSPKRQDAEELLNVGESLRLRSMALTLRSVSDGVARFDVSIGIDADPKEKKSKKSATGAMWMTLDGTLLVTVSTARPVSLDVSGPLQMNVKKPNGGHAADGSGNAAMRIDYTF
jgi:hypothetical protein